MRNLGMLENGSTVPCGSGISFTAVAIFEWELGTHAEKQLEGGWHWQADSDINLVRELRLLSAAMAAALITGMLGLRGSRSLLPVGSRGLVAHHDDGQDGP